MVRGRPSPEKIKITNELNQLYGLMKRTQRSVAYLQSLGVNVGMAGSRLRSFEQELNIATRRRIAALEAIERA